MPKIKGIRIGITDKYSRTMFRRDVDIELDDGVKTNLTYKGDGVKSLITIALLSQVRAIKNRIIIVDEPENHLHPEAIHYIKDVLYNIPKNNQVLIATHSPILVNRTDVKSNIIVENNEAKPAQKIDEIRKSLGVLTSDNLQYADYVIVVEGLTDKTFIETYIKRYKPSLQKHIQSNKMQIRSIGGTNNLMYELCGLERYFCNYIVLLDNDSAGKTAKEKAIRELNIDGNRFRFYTCANGRDTELEDLYLDTVYEQYMVEKGISVSCGDYKNKSRKWADRIKAAAKASGSDITKDMENQYKQEIVNIVISDINESLTPQAKDLLETIFTYVEEQIRL